jgi:hypothetical protein
MLARLRQDRSMKIGAGECLTCPTCGERSDQPHGSTTAPRVDVFGDRALRCSKGSKLHTIWHDGIKYVYAFLAKMAGVFQQMMGLVSSPPWPIFAPPFSPTMENALEPPPHQATLPPSARLPRTPSGCPRQRPRACPSSPLSAKTAAALESELYASLTFWRPTPAPPSASAGL